ncbi:hypothetical protein [Amycolatopsis rhizosphaerae]|nr:hypothetical protein [Amycolatopsis rhizosphaerae]
MSNSTQTRLWASGGLRPVAAALLLAAATASVGTTFATPGWRR